jgi:uracil-DNA glycosylase family 4
VARIVKATGPIPCRYMIIAERPGKVEHRMGYALQGPSGQELNRYLSVNASIDRESVYCTNLVKDYRDDESPSLEEIMRDGILLKAEIETVHPEFILAMGLYAARWLLGPEIEMEWASGLCFPKYVVDYGNVKIMPVIHVAAGLHQSRYAAQIAYGFEQFGKMCRGEAMPTRHLQDTEPTPLYKEMRELRVGAYDIGIDTEGSTEAPWCVSGSDLAGCGGIVRGGRVDISKANVIFHHAIHDLQVLEALGIEVGTFSDTMVMASLLGTEPLGLKALARRHCGMQMQDYTDVIAPASRDLALEYLTRVLDYAGTES